MIFSVGEVDVKGLQRFENMLGALGAEAPKAVNRALNRAGDMAQVRVVRTLAKQTGLPAKTIRKAVRVKRSTWADMTYTMRSAGGDVSLKFFKPRETRSGVSAAPFGQRQVFEGSFIKGGQFPRRVLLSMGDHVFQRDGLARLPIDKLDSGVVIPAEMVRGATRDVFEEIVEDVLPLRLDHEISRLLGL